MLSRFIGSSFGPAQTQVGATLPRKLLYIPEAQQASKGYAYTWMVGTSLSDLSLFVRSSYLLKKYICVAVTHPSIWENSY